MGLFHRASHAVSSAANNVGSGLGIHGNATNGRFGAKTLSREIHDDPGGTFRKFLTDSTNYTGLTAIGNGMNHTGTYGRVGSAALGVAGPTYAVDVASGREKWDNRTAGRRMSAYTAYEDSKYEKKHKIYEQQDRDQQAEQQRVDQAIAELHAAYGIGDGGDAMHNRALLEGDYGNYARDYIASNSASAQQGFDANQRAARFWAADRGQSGGSVDAGNQMGNLQGLLGQESQIAANARSGVDNLRMNDQASMLQGQGDILGGGATDQSILDGLSAHSRAIQSARGQIGEDTVGQLASYGGSLVAQNAQASGYYGGAQPSYGMPGDAGYNPYYTGRARSPGLFGRGSGGNSISG